MTPRNRPYYVWVTWLTALLAGEARCQFAPWVKSHFKFDKPQKDMTEWIDGHSKLLQQRRDELQNDHWDVTVEDQNAFILNGLTATLAGKPDLIARRAGQVLVIDAKTGKQRSRDYWQVLTYLAALPKAFRFDPTTVYGEVCYPSIRVTVPNSELDAVSSQRIWSLIQVVAGEEVPQATPSAAECRFCDVPKSVCPARIEYAPHEAVLGCGLCHPSFLGRGYVERDTMHAGRVRRG